MVMGRPTIYSEELADRICALVATNPVGLPKLCKMFPELPNVDTIKDWRWKKPEFSAKYTEAKRFQAEVMAESTEDVIDDLEQFVFSDKEGATRLDSGLVGKARLLCDTRRWHASKLAPKLYGDQKQIEQLQDNNIRLQQELNELRNQLAEKHKKDY